MRKRRFGLNSKQVSKRTRRKSTLIIEKQYHVLSAIPVAPWSDRKVKKIIDANPCKEIEMVS